MNRLLVVKIVIARRLRKKKFQRNSDWRYCKTNKNKQSIFNMLGHCAHRSETRVDLRT